jgi:hypothetical protein
MIGLNIQGLIDWLTRVGIVGVVIFMGVGFQQGWWSFRRELDAKDEALIAMTKDRDMWRERAMTALMVGDRMAQSTIRALPDLRAEASAS